MKTMQIELAERLGGIEEYYFSKKNQEIDRLRQSGKFPEVISLGIGSPDQPPHPDVIAELGKAAQDPKVHGYQPYRGAAILRNAFSEWYKKYYNVTLDPATEILPLIGSKEGIMHICMTYLSKGDKALIPNPGYPTYRSAVTLAGGTCVPYSLREANDWQPDFDELEKLCKEGGIKLMLVNYPNMPTGTLPKPGLFKKLVDFARTHNVLLVHDNPYSFLRTEKPESLLSVEGALEVSLEMNSLSKSHSMAGWRVGMIGGAKERIDEILRFKSNMDSGMFYPMQAAAAKALSLGEEWFSQLNAMYRRREAKAFQIMDLLNLKYNPHQAGLFTWGRLPEEIEDAFKFSDEILYGCGVFITPGAIFGTEGSRYMRISLCATEDALQRAHDKIKAMLCK